MLIPLCILWLFKGSNEVEPRKAKTIIKKDM